VATSTTYARVVTTVHVYQNFQLTDLTVRDGRGVTTVLDTTQHHPVFSKTRNEWVDADALQAGERLYTGAGDAWVASVYNFTGNQRMYNLTVEVTHTYYVLAGGSVVLVHNAGGEGLPAAARVPSLRGLNQTAADNLLGKHGFELKSISNSGAWATYKHPDGSTVSVELGNGRIVRTSMVDPGPNAKNFPQRWNPDGTRTGEHDTGERLCP
jgi:hypothetical protein